MAASLIALCARLRPTLSHRIALHFDPMCVMHEPVENAVGQSGIPDLLVPARDR